jgi:hypothetical protein
LLKLSRAHLYKDELEHEILATLPRLLYTLFMVKVFSFGKAKNSPKNETLANHCIKLLVMLYWRGVGLKGRLSLRRFATWNTGSVGNISLGFEGEIEPEKVCNRSYEVRRRTFLV